MLDSFEILTTSGVVLWSKSYVNVKGGLINNFIRDVFIEERAPQASASDAAAAPNPSYKKDQYTLRWTSVKDLGLIFVAVYQSLLQLTWVDKLLENIRIIFTDLYGDQLRKPYTSVVECENFDEYFDQQVKELEGNASKPEQHAPRIHIHDAQSSSGTNTPLQHDVDQQRLSNSLYDGLSADSTPNTSRPSTPGSQVVTGNAHPKGASRRARKAASAASSMLGSGDERKLKGKKDKAKKMRTWDDSGMAGEGDGASLDYSQPAERSEEKVSVVPQEPMNMDVTGTRTKKGQYLLKDLDNEVHSILQNAQDKKDAEQTSVPSGLVGSSLGAISGLFKNVVGGKVLTKADLDKPMKGMEEHLLKKNVAREAVVRLCEGVEKDLAGVKTGSFETIDTKIRNSLASSLRQLLTPTTSLDILRAITAVTQPGTGALAPKPRPYVISIVGVNGVGKSTNLSKLAFFLLQNNFSLLIAACDTFRSGAVEQLRVHARNLRELSDRENLGNIELYERGYGKDAANIAKDAISYAASQAFDVVLIDTAGRRHNDARLMGSLEKFAQFARPDKILMVGEALVGTDSVAQARAFDKAFGKERHLDGFIISKCDTVGDMIGSLVSMVHATGIPVVFLGVGQHYGDLQTLNVQWAVRMLMS